MFYLVPTRYEKREPRTKIRNSLSKLFNELLLMFLQEAGVTDILVVGNKDFQKDTVLELGISEDCYCDSRTQDVEQWILEKTNDG